MSVLRADKREASRLQDGHSSKQINYSMAVALTRAGNLPCASVSPGAESGIMASRLNSHPTRLGRRPVTSNKPTFQGTTHMLVHTRVTARH